MFFELAQGRKLPDAYWDFIPDLKTLLGKSFFGILQIIPRNLKISAESRVVAGILGYSVEFAPEIFWAESGHDLIGHNGTIKHDKLLSAKRKLCSHSSLILDF